jgi:hypothetical protein
MLYFFRGKLPLPVKTAAAMTLVAIGCGGSGGGNSAKSKPNDPSATDSIDLGFHIDDYFEGTDMFKGLGVIPFKLLVIHN